MVLKNLLLSFFSFFVLTLQPFIPLNMKQLAQIEKKLLDFHLQV